MMFYERQQNFGAANIPITTTHDGGVSFENLKDNKRGMDGLNKLNADIKTGNIQLEDTNFAGEHTFAAPHNNNLARHQNSDEDYGEGEDFEDDNQTFNSNQRRGDKEMREDPLT